MAYTSVQQSESRLHREMEAMRIALGLPSPEPKQEIHNPLSPHVQHRAVATERTPGVTIMLSVRSAAGGSSFRFEYNSQTISRCQALCEARQLAHKQGLTVQCVLDIIEANQASPFNSSHLASKTLAKARKRLG